MYDFAKFDVLRQAGLANNREDALDVRNPRPSFPRNSRLSAIFHDFCPPNRTEENGPRRSDWHDTWLWNGSSWNPTSPAASPQARFAPAMAFDQLHSQAVLFGGNTGSTPLNDTWLWNGTTWTHTMPASTPPSRSDASMVYDAAHGQILMFGGLGSGYLSDTWVWDGTGWTQLSPASAPQLARTHRWPLMYNMPESSSWVEPMPAEP
jgi:hypothetical protein